MNALDLILEYLQENGIKAKAILRQKGTGDAHRLNIDDDISITTHSPDKTKVQVRFRRFQRPGREFFWEQIWEYDLHQPDSLQKILACVQDRFDGRPDKASWDTLEGPQRTDGKPPNLDIQGGTEWIKCILKLLDNTYPWKH
jgi:hypothetical protein